MLQNRVLGWVILWAICFAIGYAKAAEVPQVFTDGTLTVEGKVVDEKWTGTFKMNGQTYPATAEGEDDGTVTGTFTASGQAFPFTGLIKGDTLILNTGGKTYTLKAKATVPPAVANPLGNDAVAKPAPTPVPVKKDEAAPAVQAAGVPAGYTLAQRSVVGQSMTATKAGVASVQDALADAVGDITPMFDARPVVIGAYEDAQTHRTGGAMFTATLEGKPVRGMISAQIAEGNDQIGAKVAVLYANADATAADIKALTAPPPIANQQAVANPQADAAPAAPAKPKSNEELAAAMAAVPLKRYDFPDGTGSIGVAEGWQINSQSALDCNYIQGPAGQHVAIGATFNPALPTARLAGMPGVLVMPFDDPQPTLQRLIPILSQQSQAAGGPAMKLEKIFDTQPVPPTRPGERGEILNYLITYTANGKSMQTRNNARVVCMPPNQADLWLLYIVEMSAPVESWDTDVVTMLAMMKSRFENVAVCQQVDAQRQQAIIQQGEANRARLKAMFDAGQARHAAQMASFDAYNKNWETNQNRVARGNDDFVELMRGTRTVVDTQTNTKWDNDLTNVDAVVNGLNAGQPGRFVQVPFRDEMDPVKR